MEYVDAAGGVQAVQANPRFRLDGRPIVVVVDCVAAHGPGGLSSWGRFRVWLDPLPGVEVFGRDNFAIHGGLFPGSAGCVDLTSSMDAFVERFRVHGRDMIMRVRYPLAP